MKERLLAELDARVARHADGDSTGVLDERALTLVAELMAVGAPDAGSLARVAAVHLCRYQALPPEHGELDLGLARALYTKLHTVDPRLVSRRVREFFGLASPHDRAVALMREHERTGHPGHLERAISLFRQEVLEHVDRAAAGGPDDAAHAAVLSDLAEALARRFARTGQQADLAEAVELRQAAAEAAPAGAGAALTPPDRHRSTGEGGADAW